MFEKIIFKNQHKHGPLIDIGAVAEALLFYRHVSIIADHNTLKYLLQKIPPFVLLDLVVSGRIIILYTSDSIAIGTRESKYGLPIHSLMLYEVPKFSIDILPEKVFYEKTNNRLYSKKFRNKIQELDHKQFKSEYFDSSLSNVKATESSVDSIIHLLQPDYSQPEPIRFRVEQERQGLIVDTNLDFDRFNAGYHKLVPKKDGSITTSSLLYMFLSTQQELYFASKLNSEIAVGPLNRKIHVHTIDSILESSFKNETQIKAFKSLTLESGHTIREYINSGKIPFSAVVKLLDKADKFRGWLEGKPDDQELIKYYYKAVTEDSWVDKLPAKTTRFGFFTAAGFGIDSLGGGGGVGTVTGAALGAFDTFILDKLIGGWKPHHFIERELARLLSEKS